LKWLVLRCIACDDWLWHQPLLCVWLFWQVAMQGDLAGLQGSVVELTAQKVGRRLSGQHTLSCTEPSVRCKCFHCLALPPETQSCATTLLCYVLGRFFDRPSVACIVARLLFSRDVVVGCSQDALIALISVPPEPPAIARVDGSVIVVRIAGTTPAPALLAVEAVDVQQECGPVTVVVPTAADVTLARTTSSDRLRLRWRIGGVGGPWSDWVPVVSGGRRELKMCFHCACWLPWHLCFVACSGAVIHPFIRVSCMSPET
jgi:hypothetical protein